MEKFVPFGIQLTSQTRAIHCSLFSNNAVKSYRPIAATSTISSGLTIAERGTTTSGKRSHEHAHMQPWGTFTARAQVNMFCVISKRAMSNIVLIT